MWNMLHKEEEATLMSLKDPVFRRKVDKESTKILNKCVRKAKSTRGSVAKKQDVLMKCIKARPWASWEWSQYFEAKAKGRKWRRRRR